jgi:hypothetical protein
MTHRSVVAFLSALATSEEWRLLTLNPACGARDLQSSEPASSAVREALPPASGHVKPKRTDLCSHEQIRFVSTITEF